MGVISKPRFRVLQKALGVSILTLAASAGAALALAEDSSPGALRICADPTNLPFSSNDPAHPGVYLEIGEAIGKALGRPVSYVWYRTYFGGRAVRTTMLARQCDATIGLPDSEDFMGPKVIFSKPLFNLGYAIVTPKTMTAASVDDLKGKRVAVQFETEPQNIVGPRDDITAVTVLSPEEGMKALAEGRADAAFLWAPSAGYLNKTAYDGRYAITPVEGPRLSFDAAIGFARASKPLRNSVNSVLPEVSKQFPALLAKYGMGPDTPTVVAAAQEAAPVKSDASPQPPASAASATKTAATEPAQGAGKASGPPAGDGTGPFDVAPADPPSDPKLIAEGQEVFNGTCAHCHGPNAEQSVKKIDLRRLRLRYSDGAVNMYWKTVHEGRPSKGMPTWKDVFTDQQFTQIEAFLFSIQTKE